MQRRAATASMFQSSRSFRQVCGQPMWPVACQVFDRSLVAVDPLTLITMVGGALCRTVHRGPSLLKLQPLAIDGMLANVAVRVTPGSRDRCIRVRQRAGSRNRYGKYQSRDSGRCRGMQHFVPSSEPSVGGSNPSGRARGSKDNTTPSKYHPGGLPEGPASCPILYGKPIQAEMMCQRTTDRGSDARVCHVALQRLGAL